MRTLGKKTLNTEVIGVVSKILFHINLLSTQVAIDVLKITSMAMCWEGGKNLPKFIQKRKGKEIF